MRIQVLSDSVVNQIAAGEVIERPASVVRELVDNAVDAQATDIRIALNDGGNDLIAVSDNGIGMDFSDAQTCFVRHATSKITSSADLFSIKSMGFRGEALPSIAAVSKLRLQSRTRDGEIGTEVLLEGGTVLSTSECACVAGTHIEVARLFFNTPARRKFLKSSRYEEQRVKQWLVHSSLALPQVRYRLSLNGREVLHLSPQDSLENRAQAIFRGPHVVVRYDAHPMRVEGLLLHPSQAESESSGLAIMVNKRLVSDRAIMRAVRDAFGGTLKQRQFPIGVIHLTVPSEFVDVNVHPQKSEVRFQSSGVIFKLVYDAVVNSLKDFSSPQAYSMPIGSNYQAVSRVHSSQAAEFLPLFSSEYTESIERSLQPTSVNQAAVQQTAPFRFSELRYMGQLFECYLACSGPGGFYLVDMHAAHERYNFNLIRKRLTQRMEEGALNVQVNLLPISVSLDSFERTRLESRRAELEILGFTFSDEGEGALQVTAAPALFSNADIPELLRELAQVDEDREEQNSEEALIHRLDSIAARLACHASIRSGKAMSEEEVYELFRALDKSEFSSACPHGRPVVVSFSKMDFERWFGREY